MNYNKKVAVRKTEQSENKDCKTDKGDNLVNEKPKGMNKSYPHFLLFGIENLAFLMMGIALAIASIVEWIA